MEWIATAITPGNDARPERGDEADREQNVRKRADGVEDQLADGGQEREPGEVARRENAEREREDRRESGAERGDLEALDQARADLGQKVLRKARRDEHLLERQAHARQAAAQALEIDAQAAKRPPQRAERERGRNACNEFVFLRWGHTSFLRKTVETVSMAMTSAKMIATISPSLL